MDEPLLEAVYYPSPIPSDAYALTLMGLVFDKIHFPHVYLPQTGYDPDLVRKEISRIEELSMPRQYESDAMLSMMLFLPYVKVLDGFCAFTGQSDGFGRKEEGVEDLVKELDLAIYGPHPPDFEPLHFGWHAKGLDAGDESINYPGALYYPAHAVVYAARHGIPLINDHRRIPIPSHREGSYKNDVKVLSAIAAVQCVVMVLPKIKPLMPEELMAMRDELKSYIKPFRRAVLKLAGQLNTAIGEKATTQEVEEAARFLVETEVRPQLLELKDAVENPSKRWYDRAYDLAKQAPELATSYYTMPLSLAIAKALAGVAGVLVNARNEQLKRDALARSGFYYLLQVSRHGR